MRRIDVIDMRYLDSSVIEWQRKILPLSCTLPQRVSSNISNKSNRLEDEIVGRTLLLLRYESY